MLRFSPKNTIQDFSRDELSFFNAMVDNKPSSFMFFAVPTEAQVSSYKVYPVTQIAALIAELQQITLQPHQPMELKYSARYLVNDKGELWFVRAGIPIKDFSVFEQNANKALATGYVYFSADFKSIRMIDNQCDGVVLTRERLAYPLVMLFIYAEKYLGEILLKGSDSSISRMSAERLRVLGAPSTVDSVHRLALVKANESLEVRTMDERVASKKRFFFSASPDSDFVSPTSSPQKTHRPQR